jgi:hypothetical protein
MEYKCKECGCEEFVSNPTTYDIFRSENEKLILQKSELITDELELFCRACSEKLQFELKDVII